MFYCFSCLHGKPNCFVCAFIDSLQINNVVCEVSFSILKILKFKVRRFVHFGVLFLDEYGYGEKTFHRNVKFCPRTGNLPTAYQHLSLMFLYGEKSSGRTEVICLHPGCQLWGFFPPKREF
jgi:hypothetical protein